MERAVMILIVTFLVPSAWGLAQEPKLKPVPFPQIFHGWTDIRISLSADGSWLATSAYDATLLWHVPSGKAIRDFKGDRAAISNDGKWLATVHGRRILLWDTETGKFLHTLEGQARMLTSCAFSPGDERLATAGDDGKVRIWDRAAGKLLGTLEGHVRWVWEAIWSRDGKRLATASADGTARLWDARTFKEIRQFRGNKLGVFHVALSGDGKLLATGGQDRSARIFDVATGTEKRLFGKVETEFISSMRGVAVDSQGKWIIFDEEGLAHIWEIDGKKALRSIRVPLKERYDIQSFLLSRDDKSVFCVCSNMIWIFETSTGKLVNKIEPGAVASHSVVLSDDGKTMATGTCNLFIRGEFSARIWDLSKGKEVRVVKRPEEVRAVALSGDRKFLLLGGNKGLSLHDAATGKEVRAVDVFVSDKQSLRTSDGKLAVAATLDKEVRVIDLANGKDLHRLRGHGDFIRALALTRDGKRAASTGFEKKIFVWDVIKGASLSTSQPAETFSAGALALSDDGKWVIAAGNDGNDGTIQVIDADKGSLIRTLTKKEDEPPIFTAVALSKDKSIVAAAGFSHTIRLWDPQTGKEIGSLEGHTGTIESLAFMPDGKRLVSTCSDQSTRFWDVASRKELCRCYSFMDGTWAVLDSAGRYDCAHEGDVQGLRWVVGKQSFPIRRHRDLGYDPGLLAKHLGFNQEPLRKMSD